MTIEPVLIPMQNNTNHPIYCTYSEMHYNHLELVVNNERLCKKAQQNIGSDYVLVAGSRVSKNSQYNQVHGLIFVVDRQERILHGTLFALI